MDLFASLAVSPPLALASAAGLVVGFAFIAGALLDRDAARRWLPAFPLPDADAGAQPSDAQRALGEAVAGAVERALAGGVLPELDATRQAIEASQQAQAQASRQAVEELSLHLAEHVLAPMHQQLSASAEATQQAGAAVAELSRVSATAATTLAAACRQAQEQTARLADAQHRLDERMQASADALGQRFERAAAAAQSRVDDALARLAQAAEADAARDAERRQRMTDAFEAQSAHAAQASREAREALAAAGAELAQGARAVTESVAGVRQVVAAELAGARDAYRSGLEGAFEAQNAQLEQLLGHQGERLSAAAGELLGAVREGSQMQNETINRVGLALLKMRKTIEEVTAFAERVGLGTGERLAELRAASEAMSRSALALGEQAGGLSERVTEAATLAHTTTLHHLTAYLERLGERDASFFEQADEAVARLAGTLRDIGVGLEASAATVADAVETHAALSEPAAPSADAPEEVG